MTATLAYQHKSAVHCTTNHELVISSDKAKQICDDCVDDNDWPSDGGSLATIKKKIQLNK